jgi:hypothetical protein
MHITLKRPGLNVGEYLNSVFGSTYVIHLLIIFKLQLTSLYDYKDGLRYYEIFLFNIATFETFLD